MDLEIVYRNGRQSRHEALPGRSAVRRDVCTDVATKKKKFAIGRIFANDVHEVRAARRKIVADRSESFSEVVRDIDIRPKIILSVIVECDVDRGRVEVRRLDAAYPRFLRHTGEARGDIGPLPAIIGRQPDVTIVGSDPKYARPDRGFGHGRNSPVRLGTRIITRYSTRGTGAHDDAGRIFRGKIGRDGIEVIAAIG